MPAISLCNGALYARQNGAILPLFPEKSRPADLAGTAAARRRPCLYNFLALRVGPSGMEARAQMRDASCVGNTALLDSPAVVPDAKRVTGVDRCLPLLASQGRPAGGLSFCPQQPFPAPDFPCDPPLCLPALVSAFTLGRSAKGHCHARRHEGASHCGRDPVRL